MRLRRYGDAAQPTWQQWTAQGFVPASPENIPDFLSRPQAKTLADEFQSKELLPFSPVSFRDSMMFSEHWVQSSRQYARRFLPWSALITKPYEAITRRDFPAFKPGRLWSKQPIYYFGNHTSFVASHTDITIPSFTNALDFELELGWVVGRRVRDASVEEAKRAIFGFVLVNDFSARDVQRAEMQSGLGPQKSKHFISSMSSTLVSADEIMPKLKTLVGKVELNGQLLSTTSTKGMRWSPAEVLSFLSRSETIWPGELIATGTLPSGCGMELGRLLKSGDHLRLSIEDVGEIEHHIL